MINRREFLNRTARGALAASLGTMGLEVFACNSGKIRPPNILILISDDTGWNDVGYHGSEIKTPNIDRMAQQGVEMDHFYVCPTCSPTRASLLTGRPASRYGILDPISGKSRHALPADVVTLAELLRRNGYQTAITGKWHLGLRPEVGPKKYGFDYTYGYLHGQIDQYEHVYQNGDRSWHRNDAFVDEQGHATDLISREAIRYLTDIRDKRKPFFLYITFSVPHFPVQEEAKWVEMNAHIANESRRDFAASMTHMDDSIGRILNALQAEKLEQNTLVIYLSDNGGQEKWLSGPNYYQSKFRGNEVLGDNRPLRGWKGQLYEGGIRVPAIACWKGTLAPRKVNEVVSATDMYPTLARLATAQIPDNMKAEGCDAWDVLNGGVQRKERVLYWRTKRQFAIRKGDWKLIHTGKSLNEGEHELYQMVDDPYEKNNVIRQEENKAAELWNLLGEQVAKDSIIIDED